MCLLRTLRIRPAWGAARAGFCEAPDEVVARISSLQLSALGAQGPLVRTWCPEPVTQPAS